MPPARIFRSPVSTTFCAVSSGSVDLNQPGITSRTGLLGGIGDPIGHSLSPVLHNHVLGRLGLDYRYLAFHVTPERVERVGEAMRTLGVRGLNVTLPHKQAVLSLMDHLSPEARA